MAGGLCSPGRWPRDRRGYADDASWDWPGDKLREAVLARIGSEDELEKEAFRMAELGEEGLAWVPNYSSDREHRDFVRRSSTRMSQRG